jgi:hypothetical protein
MIAKVFKEQMLILLLLAGPKIYTLKNNLISDRLLPDCVDFLHFLSWKLMMKDALTFEGESRWKRFQSEFLRTSFAPSKFPKLVLTLYSIKNIEVLLRVKFQSYRHGT